MLLYPSRATIIFASVASASVNLLAIISDVIYVKKNLLLLYQFNNHHHIIINQLSFALSNTKFELLKMYRFSIKHTTTSKTFLFLSYSRAIFDVTHEFLEFIRNFSAYKGTYVGPGKDNLKECFFLN